MGGRYIGGYMGIMGKENGNYYNIMVLYWDKGKENGNYDLWFEGGLGL